MAHVKELLALAEKSSHGTHSGAAARVKGTKKVIHAGLGGTVPM